MERDHIKADSILASLGRVYRAKIRARVYEGAFIALSILLISIFLSTILEMIFHFDTAGRAIVFFVSLALFVAAFSKYLFPHLSRLIRPPQTRNIMEAALEVGNTDPGTRDRLRNAVELMSSGAEVYHSGELAQAYVQQVFNGISPADIESAVRYRVGKTPRLSFVSSILAALLLALLFPVQSINALARVINFGRDYSTPDLYSISVYPGNAELSRGDTLRVTTKLALGAASEFPSAIILHEKYSGELEFERHRVKETSGGKYFFQLPNIRSSVEYYVSAGDQNSPRYDVRVVDLPIVEDFTVNLAYPSYTGKGRESLQDNIGDFTALVGTRVDFSLRANKDLDSAWIEFEDGSRDYLNISGRRSNGGFVIRRSGKYSIRLVDKDSLRNRDPIVYSIEALKDQYPACEITFPGKNVDLTRDMQQPLRISIGDDYGFTKLLLEYRLSSSKYIAPEKEYHSIEIPLPSKAAGEEDISYLWDLTSLNLVPEDVISYHARVFDNDLVSGPKSTTSAEYTLRLPSLQEIFSSADSEHSDLTERTQDAMNSSDELRDQLDKMVREMKTATKQMSWEQEKKMENTLQRYDSLQKKIEGVKKQLENMTQKMMENQIISPQTLEKYLELQKALQEINSPEFQDALKKLQQAIQSLNPNLVRQAMQNFQLNEDMLRKSIERTLSLLKRVQIEQKLDELQKRADQMASEQENIRKATANSDSSNSATRQRLSESQKELSKELNAENQGLSDLRKMMDQFAKEMPLNQLKQARQQLDSSAASEKMEESAKQLSQGNFAKSMMTQSEVSSALQAFKQKLSETQKSLLQNQQRETVAALQKAQQNLLEISKEQEALRDQSKVTVPNSAESRSLSEKQNELMQQLGYTAQQMMKLSDKSFTVTPQMGRQIGEAYSQMQRALSSLQSRSGESPAPAQSQAMGSLNEAVMGIQSTLQSMMQGQGGGGFPSLMQQLQQMAGKQEGLNALTRELGEQGELSMQQQAELARLAAQQEAIHKSLGQLAREASQSQSRNQVLGDLNDIAREMQHVVTDMNNRNVTQETIQRQNRILTHLLDASRSIRQRDYDNRRVTRAGTDVVRPSPGELNLSNSESEEEQQLLKLIRQNFPPEYQQVILRYYKLLKKIPD